MVKPKSRYSCKSVIYFDLGLDSYQMKTVSLHFTTIKQMSPSTVLDGGNEIILVQIGQTINKLSAMPITYIPVKIPSHHYMLVNRSVLCNCGIKVENNFLLESLAVCLDSNSKLVMKACRSLILFVLYTCS